MNALILVVLMAFIATPVHSEPKKKQSGFKKFIQSMFQPQKKTVTRKQPRKAQPKPKPTATPKSRKRVVDSAWMAQYMEQEAAWDYEIPDDALIEWKDGKYHVPPVVFRHYEDMLNTPRPSVTPKPRSGTDAP